MPEETEQPAPEQDTADKSSAGFGDKFLNLITQGGDKKKMTTTIIAAVVALVICGLVVAAFWGIAIWALAYFRGEPNPNTGAPSGMCSMDNAFWTDPSTVELPDAKTVIQKLGKRKNLPSEENVNKILTEVRKAGFNPAITIAVWGKEQSFGNPNYAFGCVKCQRNFDDQLRGHIGSLKDATNGTGYYENKPAGANTFKWWLDIYTPASDKANNIPEDRMIIFTLLKRLVPKQITCTGSGSLGPVDINNLSSWYFNQGPDTSRGGGDWGGKHGQCDGWTKTYKDSGCGITSMAMLARYYGKNINPYQMGGESCIVGGRTLDLNPDQVRSISKKVFGMTANIVPDPSAEQIKSALSHGPLLAQARDGHQIFNSHGGHFVVIVAVQGDNFIINDPSARTGKYAGAAGRVVPIAERGTVDRIYYFTK